MNGIYLLFGSNLGHRLDNLRTTATKLIDHKIQIIKASSIYETEAWGIQDQQSFLNMIVEVETSLPPDALLKKILEIEVEMGRIRKEKWRERLIDIDILYYEDHILEQHELTLPHPGIPDRRFTLIPLTELNPLAVHPKLKKNQAELLAACRDELACEITDFKL